MDKKHSLQQLSQSNTLAEITVTAGQRLFSEGQNNSGLFKLISGEAFATITIDDKPLRTVKLSTEQWIGEIRHSESDAYQFSVECDVDCVFHSVAWHDVELNDDAKEFAQHLLFPLATRLHQVKSLHRGLSNVYPDISVEFLQEMLRYAKFIQLQTNECIFYDGDKGDGAFFLINGRLEVQVGKRRTMVAHINRGELFGEMAVLSGEDRSATVMASRTSDVIQLSNRSFQLLARKYPPLNQYVINTLIQRLRNQNKRIERANRPVNRVVLSLDSGKSAGAMHKLKGLLEKQGQAATTIESLLSQIGGSDSEQPSAEEITDFLEKQEIDNKLNVYLAEANRSFWASLCLARADEVWLLVSAKDDKKAVLDKLRPYTSSPYWPNLSINVVLLHVTDEIQGTESWKEVLNADRHFHIVTNDDNSYKRTSRALIDRSIGLVLGGGGAKGFAHIGVIQAFEEAGISVDCIGGTSIGSVMGGWLARGWKVDRIKDAIEQYFVSVNPLGDYTLPVVSLSRSQRLDKLLHDSFREITIENLPLPFFCVSSNLSKAKEVCHEQGSVWRAIRASLSIPGVITPVIKDGHFLVDGGLLNNLPCDLMVSRNSGTVIAIDVSDSKFKETELQTIPSPWSLVWKKWVNRQPTMVPSILETMLHSTMLASEIRRNENKQKVDFYIRPKVGDFGMLEFTSADAIMQRGYESGQGMVETIKARLAG